MVTMEANPCTMHNVSDGPLAPFHAPHYHFGMLLGVTDFETEQAYHRGKTWLHNSSLHQEGVARGFDVRVDAPNDEIRVLPGLAFDARGRELHLDADACLNVPAWFEAHRDDPGFEFTDENNVVTFDGHVVIRFKSCLSRQVPALMEPCDGNRSSTAYSRFTETVEIFLRPGPAPEKAGAYHRLRLLFGLDAPREEEGAIVPADQEVLDAPSTLSSFRRFAALDEIDFAPIDPAEDVVVVLANINGITLSRLNDVLELSGGDVDVAVRPSHVATSTIQELLCGGLGPAGGPSLGGFALTDTEVELTASAPLQAASVTADAFSLSIFDSAAGWSTVAVTSAYDAADNKITLTFAALPAGPLLVRLIARGSGPTPILGENMVPIHNGTDFVHMHRRS